MTNGKTINHEAHPVAPSVAQSGHDQAKYPDEPAQTPNITHHPFGTSPMCRLALPVVFDDDSPLLPVLSSVLHTTFAVSLSSQASGRMAPLYADYRSFLEITLHLPHLTL